MCRIHYALVVPKADTKRVKTELESQGLLYKRVAISKFEVDGKHDHMVLPLTLEAEHSQRALFGEVIGKASALLRTVGRFDELPELGDYDVAIVDIEHDSTALNKLQISLARSLEACKGSVMPFIDANRENLLATIPSAYTIYQPMLLLPVNFVDHETWFTLLKELEADAEAKAAFFQRLTAEMGTTHVAINAPVLAEIQDNNTAAAQENVIRSPSQIQPIYGDFGPQLRPFPHYVPSTQDFEQAFWVSTTQNGITQIWAPLYTMFSGGNVTEKARILRLHSVIESIRQGQDDRRGCTAVDLFSGIGYFAFSYAKAGVAKVLCWDLNPWSIEGLRRGATVNRWTYRTVVECQNEVQACTQIDLMDAANDAETFLLSCEDNKHATSRIATMRDRLPPIRHVNCGMLPTAGASWQIALEVIDPGLGGWIHLHESMNEKDASNQANAYVAMLQRHRDAVVGSNEQMGRITYEATFRVKSMGPRLWHHVMDFWVPPRS